MNTTLYRRGALFAIAVVAIAILCNVAAPAAVKMSTGIRYVITNGAADECSSKAKTALDAYLQGASESSPGSGEWVATGPIGASGPPSAAATVSCSPVGKGYVVTFTCVVEEPDNPYAADALCLDVAHNFSGKPVTPLAKATPMPTGCTTANIIGTWTVDSGGDKPGLTFKMDPNGDLTDSDGISGNWALYGTSVTLTYYGNHSLTLAPDGKHMSGGGYKLTRKC